MSRGSIPTTGIALGFCVFCVAVGCADNSDGPPYPAAFETLPLSIVLDVQRSAPGMFHVSINSAGETEVTTGDNTRKNRIALSADAQTRLRRIAKAEHFFTLPSRIGRPVIDDTEIFVTMTLGHYSRSVVLYASSSNESEEAARFTTVYKGIVGSVREQLSESELLGVPSLD